MSPKEVLALEQQVLEGRFPDYLWQVGIRGLRGFPDAKPLVIHFPFPVTAIAGANGAGKSTLLAAVYLAYKHVHRGGIRVPRPVEVFPKTTFDDLRGAEIRYRYIVREASPQEPRIAYPRDRWDRDLALFPRKQVAFFRLSRMALQSERRPLGRWPSRRDAFDVLDLEERLVTEIGRILGRAYRRITKVSLRDAPRFEFFVVRDLHDREYSSFHMGAGEESVIRLVYTLEQLDVGSLVVVDEVESSLHPDAQRRLVEYFLKGAQERQIQTVVSTHSPVVLDQLPPSGRWFLRRDDHTVEAYHRVAVEFAARQLDPVFPAIPVYVEDELARTWLNELLRAGLGVQAHQFVVVVAGGADTIARLVKHRVAAEGRRACLGVLDGDQRERYEGAPNVLFLPGREAPELELLAPLRLGHPEASEERAALARHLQRPEAEVGRTLDAVLAGYEGGYYDHHALIPLLAGQLGVAEAVVRHALVTLWIRGEDRLAAARPLWECLQAF
jgi:predicted ATPase